VRKLTATILILVIPIAALGHGGGLDKCGGHKNRKEGGYHVHNEKKYCACYAKDPACRSIADEIDAAISANEKAAGKIKLGDSKTAVWSLLKPIHDRLPREHRKEPESYIRDGKTVEIFFARSRRIPDGRTTDDEFTPYVVEDGILVAKGWTYLGGPSTEGSAGSNPQDW
jgi:hypothetical protein